MWCDEVLPEALHWGLDANFIINGARLSEHVALLDCQLIHAQSIDYAFFVRAGGVRSMVPSVAELEMAGKQQGVMKPCTVLLSLTARDAISSAGR